MHMPHTLDQVLPTNAQHDTFCQKLKDCEQEWWQARQRLITLKERRMFWFGDNSLIMWLLWQFVSYVIVAIVIMLISRIFDISLTLGQYSAIFLVQTIIFIAMFAIKGRLANRLQNSINEANIARAQALSEMVILAADSVFPDTHRIAPISLQQIYERYDGALRLASLQCLLQSEIDAGRLLLGEHQIEAQVLPPELADHELPTYADQMIYKSLVR